MADEVQREVLEVDVLIVGGGAAGLAAAIRLGQLIAEHPDAFPEAPSIALVEKGSEIGAHILSGAVMKPKALDELLPGWADEAPIGNKVRLEEFCFMTETLGIPGPLPPPMHNEGSYVVSASRMARWMSEKAEALGINIFCGFPAVEVLWEGDRVAGVQTGDKGIDAHGNRKDNFEPGIELRAKGTIFAEGVLGHCTRIVTKRLNLDEGRNPWQFETGVKEIIKVPEGRGCPGYVLHTLGWPFDKDTFGGTWVYGLDDRHISIGLVVGMGYTDPGIDPHYMLQQFKSHPKIARIIAGGTVEEYGGKALSIGGWYAVPQPYFSGGMFVGESAHLMDGAALKGLHLAQKSGMLAAETAFACLQTGDFSEASTAAYGEALENSWVKDQMWASRNFHQNFDRGFWLGLARTVTQQVLGPGPRRPGHHDHAALEPIAVATGGSLEKSAQPKIEIPSWKQKLDDVFLSGTLHEEDQPSHLKVADPDICRTRCTEEFGNPCTRFCPAPVYEMFEDAEQGGQRLQVNFSNCVHCKTCDIK
ncbi:MAG: electron-transfer flavoprotein:ubiquinone oxidoreductase, partial [Myxococcota bacterium]|nr:electron-transfer flavoprotein:ubiquinone oxidoreductase [Myxococcota bacterium]